MAAARPGQLGATARLRQLGATVRPHQLGATARPRQLGATDRPRQLGAAAARVPHHSSRRKLEQVSLGTQVLVLKAKQNKSCLSFIKWCV